MDDNNSELEELKIDRQRRAMLRAGESGGASVTLKDTRVSKALAWFWGIVGTCIAGGVWLAANNLYQLNLTVQRIADNNAMVASQLADHEARVRQLERDVSTIEGRVFRGLDGYQQEPKPEASRRGH